MNYVALKPVNFGGKQYKIGEIIPEGVVDERRSLFLKKSGHIAEVASVNGAYAEDLNVNPNTLINSFITIKARACSERTAVITVLCHNSENN